MIKRELYLSKIRPFYDSDLIKVIVGIRRAGKSTIMMQIIDELKDKNISEEQIIYINFEYKEFSFIRNDDDLYSYIKSFIKNDSKYYIFLDEIQNAYSIVNPNLTSGKHVLAKKNDENIVSFVNTVLAISKKRNIDLDFLIKNGF